jgi:sarcosine oxidase
MIAAQLSVAVQHCATVVAEEVVAVTRRSGGGWVVRTASRSIVAAQIVVAAGPHADELAGLPRRPHLDVIAEAVLLGRVSATEQRRLADLPSVIVDEASRGHCYIVPPTRYPDSRTYVKLGATLRRQMVLTPAQRRQWMAGDAHAEDIAWMQDLMLATLPGLQVEQWLTKPCLIPETPTRLPYIEIVDEGCVMAVGGNGYAAKSADAIGALAVGLVLNGSWTDVELDASSFTLIAE